MAPSKKIIQILKLTPKYYLGNIEQKPIRKFKSQSTLESLLRLTFAIAIGVAIIQSVSLGSTINQGENRTVNVTRFNTTVFVKDQNAFQQSLQTQDESSESLDATSSSKSNSESLLVNTVSFNGSIDNTSNTVVLSEYLPSIAIPILIALIAWMLLKILYRSYFSTVFSFGIIKEIRIITWSIVSIISIEIVAPQVQTSVLRNRGFLNSYGDVTYHFEMGLVVLAVVIAMLGTLASKVLKDAISMKEEIDGTV